MKTLNTSLVVEAALAGLFAASFVVPAAAQDAAPKGGAAPAPAPTAAPAKKGVEPALVAAEKARAAALADGLSKWAAGIPSQGPGASK